VKSTIDEEELIAVEPVELHVDLVVIHVAIEYQAIGRGTLKGQLGFRVPPGELQGAALRINA
jgi:hypothetical protein